VAVIKVGAPTETELKEKKHRVEDALSAARAAQEEGIVAGGEISLLNSMPKLEKLLKGSEEDEETRVGINIVKKALEGADSPASRQRGPGWLSDHRHCATDATEQKNKNIGFNVLTGKYNRLD